MTRHLVVPKKDAQKVLQDLRRRKMVDNSLSVFSRYDSVLIPLVADAVFEWEYRTEEIEGQPARIKHLPANTHGAFDLIGHVAITKIRNQERASRLAQELMRTNRSIHTVYLDSGITGEYRTRNLTLLAGSDDSLTVYRENGINMIMDIKKVYFSPRLATERMLVAKAVSDGEEILDMFSGIGPFALNIAKYHRCHITAVDSNPDAIHYLGESAKMNRLVGNITPIYGDIALLIGDMGRFHRIIMNLPHDSFRYLSYAREHLIPGGILHYYEILDQFALEERMSLLRGQGFSLLSKRVVHGYSARESMYSLWLKN